MEGLYSVVTSLYSLLYTVIISVICAVPPIIPELILALNQALASTKRNRRDCFWPLSTHTLLLLY